MSDKEYYDLYNEMITGLEGFMDRFTKKRLSEIISAYGERGIVSGISIDLKNELKEIYDTLYERSSKATQRFFEKTNGYKVSDDALNNINTRIQVQGKLDSRIDYINSEINRKLSKIHFESQRIVQFEERAIFSQDLQSRIIQEASKSINETELNNAINNQLEEYNELRTDDITSSDELEEVGFKTWITRRDNRVRPTHAEVHGTKIPELDYFKVGNGQLLKPADFLGLYPTTQDLLSEVINCRCVLRYS